MKNKILAEKVNYFILPGVIVGAKINIDLGRILLKATQSYNEITGDNIQVADARTKNSKRKLVTIRQLYCKAINDLYGKNIQLKITAKEINVDHTTVLHSIKKANDYYGTEKQFKEIYDNLWKKTKKNLKRYLVWFNNTL